MTFFYPSGFNGEFFKSPALGGFPALTGMFAKFSANDPAQAATAVHVTFAPSDVNTGTNIIALSNSLAFNRQASAYAHATPVYFSSTGALPAPLQANTEYFLAKESTGTFAVFPVPSGTDYQNQPGRLSVETQFDAQNFAQNVNKIVFTDQGTGTHTLYTKPLTQTIYDLSGNSYNGTTQPDYNCQVEVDTDENGFRFFRMRRNADDPFAANYTARGKVITNGSVTAIKMLLSGKRTLAYTFVCKILDFSWQGYPKSYHTNSSINASGVFTYSDPDGSVSGVPFNTADLVNVATSAGGTLPIELSAGIDYFARKINTTTYSLHPTATDATNNTNIITLTPVNGNKLLVYAPARIGGTGQWGFFSTIYGTISGASFNALAPRTLHYGFVSRNIIQMKSATMSAAGEWFTNATGPNYLDLTKVKVTMPPRAIPPTRADSGASFVVPGTTANFWVTRGTTNNGRLRFHDTLAQAQASIGVATASLAQANASNPSAAACVKFNSASITSAFGEAWVMRDDGNISMSWNIQTGTGEIQDPNVSFPTGQLIVVTFLADYNPSDSVNGYLKTYINGSLVSTSDSGAAAAPIANWDNDTSGAAFALWSDAQPHVMFHGDMYDTVFQTSTGAISDSEIAALHHYYMSQYGIRV